MGYMESTVRQNARQALQNAIVARLAQGGTAETLAAIATRALDLPAGFPVQAWEIQNIASGVSTLGPKAARKVIKAIS